MTSSLGAQALLGGAVAQPGDELAGLVFSGELQQGTGRRRLSHLLGVAAPPKPFVF